MITTHSTEETYAYAKKISETLKPGDIITLQGDLGSGKTTFTQGLGKALGITRPITSPTFLFIKSYSIEKGVIKKLYHVDLYRIEKEEDIKGLGLMEMLSDSEAITVIEWPEKMGSLLPQRRIALEFEYVDENTRRIEVRS
ncbi:MAG: tRNA (adenosine(37)-N6)-threonylcarbamoyltransferase complex ATPase subunit type 1 TsaE [Patescibacteria group bacterium]